jgi:hypothetical protein
MWAFSASPVCRPKAAGLISGTVVAFIAAERRDLVECGRAALRFEEQEADIVASSTQWGHFSMNEGHSNIHARDTPCSASV